MRNRKSILVVLFLFMCVALGFAHGKKDIEEQNVDNLNSWQQEFDLESKTKKKATKYNIMITAKDLGGNEHIEGPFNLYIDPESDKPICGITNPYRDMRVVGNLNIVGTCVDDDGVSKVELILDENTENEVTVLADGQEFWSYYLDTNHLEEGPHTIKVIGYDINDEPVTSNPVVVQWQLDRKQPLTDVLNLGMGQLVSGKVTFDGTVEDGNGIRELSYSEDNGKNFKNIKLSKTKEMSVSKFNISIDTRAFDDGPAVIWFKAVDNAGSVGTYAHLYFIDNTKPDVQIVSPAAEEVSNGEFTIAGFAKDDVGITALSWTFGEESGVFDLIPGNPYWAVTVNTIGSNEKSRKFTITATDRANNVVEISRNIALNQEEDKPLVTISEPVEGQIFNGDEEAVFVRGFASDDDALKAVKIRLDEGEEFIQETRGAFYLDLCKAKDLSAGNHTITVIGVDKNGVEGNPSVVEFVSKGIAPEFGSPLLEGGEELPFVNGMEIHPEAGKSFVLPISSQMGIKEIYSQISWGNNNVIENTIQLKNDGEYNLSLPITPDTPKGVISIIVKAKDAIDRVSEYKAFAYITNTSKINSDELKVIFDDSTVAEDGSIICNSEFPVTGYVIGGNVSMVNGKVELVPPTKFATPVIAANNLIKLVPGKEIGSSEAVVVRVTTDDGKVCESRPLIFKADKELPVIKFNNASATKALDVKSGQATISGSVSCKTGVGPLSYKVISIPVVKNPKDGTISKINYADTSSDYQKLSLSEDGSFALKLDVANLAEGMHIVEFVAESAGGNKAAKAFVIDTILEIPQAAEGEKQVSPKGAATVWADSFDVYAVSVYQGDQDIDYQSFYRADMQEGANPLVFNASKYTANKNPTLQANFALVDDMPYLSGMPIILPYGPVKEASKLVIYIDTGASVNSVSYEISGDEVAGGDLLQKGSAKLIKPEEGSNRWIAEIPLNNLPSRVNKIKAIVKAGSLEKEISASISVVRAVEKTNINDGKKLFVFQDEITKFDEVKSNWVLSNGSKYFVYANVPLPMKAEFIQPVDGLELSVNGHFITLSASKEAEFKNVSVKVTDGFGDVYVTEAVNFLSDTQGPILNINTPVLHDWLGSLVKIQGTAQDTLGVRSVEYSLDNGVTWTEFALSGDAKGLGVTFTKDVDLSSKADGLIKIDIRAIDNAGHISEFRTACFKDTTAPEVSVVQPLPVDIVNGENIIVFDVRDNGYFNKVEYVMSANQQTPIRNEISIEPLVYTTVGTENQPIDDIMTFEFSDEAGNKKIVDVWDFSIDNESDLPITEIHVPGEMEVLTRDFTISGVVYDDDGDSTIWYKLDNQEYKQLPQAGTSFAIDVPISSMTDNEHTISVYAVDINGVKGNEVSRTFRISLEEPKGSVLSPTIDTSVRDVVEISGVASDKNGIQKVEISLDNGNSYNDAVGTEEWKYTVDTRAIPGGTQVVFLRITDNYGITGLYSSLINIDNEAPKISLDLPLDDSSSTGQLFFSGYAFDNVEITKMYVTIRNMDKISNVIQREFEIHSIIGQTLDISDLEDGFYNVEFTGEDMAGNKTNVSRNIHLDKNMPAAVVDVLYPLNGEHKNGKFNIYGQANSNLESKIKTLKLYVDDIFVKETELTRSGFFKFEISPASEVETGEVDEKGNPITKLVTDMQDGLHKYRVDAILENGEQVPSKEQTVTYSATGPWITLDNFVYGDFAFDRPYLRGSAGYSLSPEEVVYAKSKEATKEEKEAFEAKSIEKIELSFDNGKTFELLSNKEKWMYRVENQDLTEGYHFMLIRATMKNGEVAIERTIVQIDNTAPSVRLIAPDNGGRYNQTMVAAGLSRDDVGLESVKVTLRKGDKSSYEVPSFIQGLYLDFNFWGATLFNIGAGLTFFDDNVKLQFQWGQFTQEQRNAVFNVLGLPSTDMRYGGDNILGGKILANIASIPFSYFFGHDWEWLYASFAVGANFTRFNETNSGKPQFLSALVIQMEFPRVSFPDLNMFSAFSFYTEGSLWFIPTDISGAVDIQNMVPQISVGLRVNIF